MLPSIKRVGKMDEVAILEGEALERFLEHMQNAINSGRVRRLRFAVDGGLKIKVNELVWSPPYGKMDD